MGARLDVERLGLAFQSRPDLIQQIQAAADSPARVSLFNSISSYVHDQLRGGSGDDEPAHKRRRVDGGENGQAAAGHNSNGSGLPARQAAGAAASSSADGGLAAVAAETVLLEIKDISVSIPQRKKFDLCFTKHYLYARASGTMSPVPGIVYAWKDIEHIFYVPVPEKAQLQYNYILLPRGVALASLTKPAAPQLPDPLLFTVPATAPKPGVVGGPSAGLAAAVSDSYQALLHWALEGQLRSAGNAYVQAIVATDPRVFHSAARQPFRPAEKAVHVRAFRGSKDGYLFFLPAGILWAFKKPLLFLPLDRIVAVSYTSVLQRTFNMVVEVDVGGDSGEAEVEFGMLDQEDYGGIDETYVRRHGLQDRSMAERRKAKRELAENARGDGKRRGGEGGEGGEGDEDEEDGDEDGANGHAAGEDDGLTELQRAEQQLQDDEDDLEEDYDPGSDGESDGSGASSEEEEEEGGEGDEVEEGDEEVEGGGEEDEDDEGAEVEEEE